jgi:hypothetical protein
MPDDKDQGQSSQSQDQQLQKDQNQGGFPYEETTTRIRKSEDNGPGEIPRDFPKETKSSEQ